MTAAVLLMTVVTVKGVTFLEKPLVISPADSGTTYVGEEGAILCGGVKLGPWTDRGGGVWEADAPTARVCRTRVTSASSIFRRADGPSHGHCTAAWDVAAC